MSQKQLITKLDKLSRLLEEAEKYPVIGCHSELISRAKVLISEIYKEVKVSGKTQKNKISEIIQISHLVVDLLLKIGNGIREFISCKNVGVIIWNYLRF